MKRTLEVFVGLNALGEEERIPLPSAGQVARLRYEAERARTRARQLYRNIRDQEASLGVGTDEIERELAQQEIAQARSQAASETQRAAVSEALANEMEFHRSQAGLGTVETWTFTVPDFGWTHDQLSQAEEAAREWADDLTPRRDDWKFRGHLLDACVGSLARPDGTTVPLADLSPAWTQPVWEALRERSEGGYDRVGFMVGSSPSSAGARA